MGTILIKIRNFDEIFNNRNKEIDDSYMIFILRLKFCELYTIKNIQLNKFYNCFKYKFINEKNICVSLSLINRQKF